MKTSLTVFLFILLSFSANAQVMETFGDSLTAGTLSKTSILNTSKSYVSQIMGDLVKYALLKEEKYLNKYGEKSDAWPAKLKDMLGDINELHNYAVPGAVTSDLVPHVKKALTTTPQTFAFFLMGHNDLCDNGLTPAAMAEKFKKQYRSALIEWDKKRENSTAFLLDVGEVHSMITAMNGYIWEKKGGHEYTCNQTWETYIPYCSAYSKLVKQNKIKEVVGKQIEAMNASLDDLVAEMNSRSSKNTFKHVKYWHGEFQPEFSASDCFHLSKKGQETLADQVFQALH